MNRGSVTAGWMTALVLASTARAGLPITHLYSGAGALAGFVIVDDHDINRYAKSVDGGFLNRDYPDDYHDYHDFDYGIRFSSYTSFYKEIYVKSVYLSDTEPK